jgi:adenylate cyclase
MNRFTRYRLSRVITILITWLIFAFVIAVHEVLFLENFDGIYESEYLADYTFTKTLLAGLSTTFIGALAIGFLEEVYFRDQFKKLAFGRIVVLKTLIYSLFLVVLTILGSLVFNGIAVGKSILDPIVIEAMLDYASSGGFWNTIIILLFAILFTIIGLQIFDKFGPGVFWKFVTGRYHDTAEEDRAFMFLDMRSSTQIAEKLGHKKYFRMLNDFFSDITNPIMENNGEIYQYVGDEVVLCWKNADYRYLFTCFAAITGLINSRTDYYSSEYGFVPEFKAGCHGGKVTVGEVGVIKREIVYTGDVLNTAARIQGMCNQLNSDFLVSEALVDSVPVGFESEEMGDIELRGKNELVRLFKIKLT